MPEMSSAAVDALAGILAMGMRWGCAGDALWMGCGCAADAYALCALRCSLAVRGLSMETQLPSLQRGDDGTADDAGAAVVPLSLVAFYIVVLKSFRVPWWVHSTVWLQWSMAVRCMRLPLESCLLPLHAVTLSQRFPSSQPLPGIVQKL